MKRQFLCAGLWAVVCFAVQSCGITELYKIDGDDKNGVWNGPAANLSPTYQIITYVSAFDYPDGYDWQSDPDRGHVKCSLVVFREGVPVLKVPVGNEYNVSPDPDMHRILDGQLYTDFSEGSETMLKKNGKPVLSYPAAEMICDLKVVDSDIYTLGHSRSGKGFSLRLNGDVLLEREAGYTFERILMEEKSPGVAFAEPIVSSEGTVERYYVMRGGKVSQVALRDDIKKVWDVAVYDDEVYYLASLTGVAAPVLVSSKGMTTLQMPSSMAVVSCRMNILEGGICVEGVLAKDNQVQSVVWGTDLKYSLFPKGMIFSALCAGEDGLHCTMNPASGTGAGLIFRGGEGLEIPSGYACMSRSAMAFASGMLTVGLSSLIGEKPALWVDGELKSLDVNGYISCVATVTL